MIGFLASLTVATLISLYIALSYYIVSIASTISWALANLIFVILLAIGIDILMKRR